MAKLSDYLESALLAHIFRNTNYSRPATIYVSLHTADPTDDGTGTEVSGGSYARQPVNTGTYSEWTAPAPEAGGGYSTTNASSIVFPTASAAWGTITHVGLWDASSGGNLLFHGALDAAVVVGNGDTFSIAGTALEIALR